MEPIGTTFVAAMRMLIGPIVFLTIIGGIASVADLRRVGLTGVKALVYFQVGTLLALASGLLAINLFPLGNGVNADASKIQVSDTVGGLIEKGESQHWWDFLTHIIPTTHGRAVRRGRHPADHLPGRHLRRRAQRARHDRRSAAGPGPALAPRSCSRSSRMS